MAVVKPARRVSGSTGVAARYIGPLPVILLYLVFRDAFVGEILPGESYTSITNRGAEGFRTCRQEEWIATEIERFQTLEEFAEDRRIGADQIVVAEYQHHQFREVSQFIWDPLGEVVVPQVEPGEFRKLSQRCGYASAQGIIVKVDSDDAFDTINLLHGNSFPSIDGSREFRVVIDPFEVKPVLRVHPRFELQQRLAIGYESSVVRRVFDNHPVLAPIRAFD